MPTFFTSNGKAPVGRTVGIPDFHTMGTVRFFDMDPPIMAATHSSIITRVQLSHQGNYQFLHTIGNDVYVYVFGDRMGSITVSGLSMQGCGVANHGIEYVMAWYRQNRIANRQIPVIISIGQASARGFVIGFSGDVVDPSVRLVQYGLQIATLPEKR